MWFDAAKGRRDMIGFSKSAFLRIAALATAGTAVSGCVYDVGLGYASDGYYNDYDCDPYDGYDSYYDCDYGYGFSNIGFGGGWYDSFWYPGYGYYLFDNRGQRHTMRDHHRRYWGERRHSWYRENRGRNGDGRRYQGRGRGYRGNATLGAIRWPENNGGRVRDDGDNGRDRGEGRRGRNDQWRGGNGNGASAVPVPNPEVVQGRGRDRGESYGIVRGEGRRGNGEGGRGVRGGERTNAAPVQQPFATPQASRAYRPAPQSHPERARQQIPRKQD